MIDSHEMIMLERRLTSLCEKLEASNTCITTQNDKLEELTATMENVGDILAGIATSLEKIVEAIPPAINGLKLVRPS